MRIFTGSQAQKRSPGLVRDWCSSFEQVCRKRSIRVTPQRLAVYKALAEDTSHPTADAIYASLHPDMSGLSLATVYRILESLEREGFAKRVSTASGAARFDANLIAHQHLVCRRCGSMTDFEERALSNLRLPREIPGFVADDLDIRIMGLCEKCNRVRKPRQ